MDVKVCLFLVILGVVCCTARELAAPDLLIKEKTEDVSGNVQAQRQLQPLKDASGSKGLCTLCEEYTATALGYLANNKTQAKILGLLLQTCSQMPIYKHECTALVDQYVPLFFLEISTIKPDDVCQKADLCQKVVSISQQFSQNGCDLCHQMVRETLSKLKDPDTQCTALVDQYVPLFFLEISTIKPDDVCQKADLCQKVVSISQQFSQNGCDLCHQMVRETLSKLKDPDTQLDILELLLKACGSVEKYANKCKKMVFEYAPVILINAEHFLEKNDVCTILHACEPVVGKEEALPEMQTSLYSAS
ncbi:uncharacterized protein LOC132606977 isoform X2 [Lycium barbarum]|nr:uncharacterized protein LOC132606977 isoform X2 [Lycium barbarum]XP_060176735.1 uncharacterized protein LOC132606977 isoform X2 [Lycium barbarum]XP_060176736.1 uncharacterized protein LOC132606977 isoform X2 [Lycium barbarum]